VKHPCGDKLSIKPSLLTEFATSEFSREDMNKAAWITETVARMKDDYPWVKMFTWFNIKKELDWRVDSSPAALAAFRAAMTDPYFLSEYRLAS
jgi:hypothetical protein